MVHFISGQKTSKDPPNTVPFLKKFRGNLHAVNHISSLDRQVHSVSLQFDRFHRWVFFVFFSFFFVLTLLEEKELAGEKKKLINFLHAILSTSCIL